MQAEVGYFIQNQKKGNKSSSLPERNLNNQLSSFMVRDVQH